jgi:hypothetical protein
VLAAGTPVRHILTSDDCVTCHGTLAWIPARFSHLNVSGSCQSCHNNITAPGKPPKHLNTTLDCGSCHNTVDWAQIAPITAPPPRTLIPAARGSGPVVK